MNISPKAVISEWPRFTYNIVFSLFSLLIREMNIIYIEENKVGVQVTHMFHISACLIGKNDIFKKYFPSGRNQ